MTELLGRQFGFWTVIANAPNKDGKRGAEARYWLCRCSCDTKIEKEVSERSLLRGKSTSCGCTRGRPSTRFVDLSGKIFNRWTVVKRGHTDKNDNTYWHCICDCGVEREVSGKSIINDMSTSCGCLKKEKAIERLKGKPTGKIEDLSGRQFDQWTVINLAQDGCHTDNGCSSVMWNCVCFCGTAKTVSGQSLKNGSSRSCGCLSPHKNKLTGQKFGRLTAIREEGRTNSGHVKWLCECECGTIKAISGQALLSGGTASCGCARRDGAIVRPDHVRKAKATKDAKRYKEDIAFNLNRRMSAMVRLALRREGAIKGRSWTDAVGYDVPDLRTRLEETMPDGYTWDDYLAGKLQIDHIVPLVAFDFQSEDDISFKQAWSLRNLQLLPKADNMTKNDRLDFSDEQAALIKEWLPAATLT